MRYNYQLHHVLIALFAQFVLLLITGNWMFSAITPMIFYTFRELWQFFHLQRTKKFDWGGCVPVWISQTLTALMGIV